MATPPLNKELLLLSLLHNTYNEMYGSVPFMFESRIITGTTTHNKHTLPAYIPQVKVLDGDWVNVLSNNGYILMNSHDPIKVCSECYGKGCTSCRRGFRKGESVDLKHVAQSYLDVAIEDIRKGLKYYKKG